MAYTFPQLKDTQVKYAWGGFIDISMNRAPDFGRLADVMHDSKAQQFQSVYYLQGFSGHGLALTGLAECGSNLKHRWPPSPAVRDCR